jgi:hypothetical protein
MHVHGHAGRVPGGVGQCLLDDPTGWLSQLLLELIGGYVNTVEVHVNTADVLVRRGVDGAASR